MLSWPTQRSPHVSWSAPSVGFQAPQFLSIVNLRCCWSPPISSRCQQFCPWDYWWSSPVEKFAKAPLKNSFPRFFASHLPPSTLLPRLRVRGCPWARRNWRWKFRPWWRRFGCRGTQFSWGWACIQVELGRTRRGARSNEGLSQSTWRTDFH